jgi:hypothetical protein
MGFRQGAEGLLHGGVVVAVLLAQFIQARAGRVELAIEDETAGIGAALFQVAQGAGTGSQDLLGSHITKE